MVRNLSARLERLESRAGLGAASLVFEPRINVKIQDQGEGQLRGYRIGKRDVLRAAGESDSELLSRALTALDHNPKEGSIVRVFEELRGP